VGENKNGKINMRQLKVMPQVENDMVFNIEVPIEFEFVKNIAKQYATSVEELSIFYEAGLQGLAKASTRLNDERFTRFSMWWVRQAIVACKMELGNDL
jgi:hypothetical protein